jgi:hypothetical protein
MLNVFSVRSIFTISNVVINIVIISIIIISIVIISIVIVSNVVVPYKCQLAQMTLGMIGTVSNVNQHNNSYHKGLNKHDPA